MENLLHWEDIDINEPHRVVLSRAKVPGGWFVRVASSSETVMGAAVFFYPDPNNEWMPSQDVLETKTFFPGMENLKNDIRE